jgi:hypothetical protein
MSAQKDACLSVCGEICEILTSNRHMLTEVSQVCSPSENFTSRCTVGIMLHGVRIENTLIGGPSFGLLEKGDIITRIDGEYVTEVEVFEKLRGCDIPGSQVVISVERYPNISPYSSRNSRDMDRDVEAQEIDVQVTRMATAEIADRRRMFDLFTLLEVNPGRKDVLRIYGPSLLLAGKLNLKSKNVVFRMNLENIRPNFLLWFRFRHVLWHTMTSRAPQR